MDQRQRDAAKADAAQAARAAVTRAAALLRELREGRGVTRNQLADEAGVNNSVVYRAERGWDGRLSTWAKLFDGLGYRLRLEADELWEEAGDLLSEEAYARQERRREGLCAGKRRFY